MTTAVASIFRTIGPRIKCNQLKGTYLHELQLFTLDYLHRSAWDLTSLQSQLFTFVHNLRPFKTTTITHLFSHLHDTESLKANVSIRHCATVIVRCCLCISIRDSNLIGFPKKSNSSIRPQLDDVCMQSLPTVTLCILYVLF